MKPVDLNSVYDAADTVAPLFAAPARLMLTAIACQESGLASRLQIGGPARGWWQCEIESIAGAFAQSVGYRLLSDACEAFTIDPTPARMFEAIAYHDAMAACVARAILLCDPLPLPALGDRDGAWECYARNWRPGAPAPDRWPAAYANALGAVAPAAPA